MKKILLVQPSLQPPGGGNGVAAWMIEALKDDYAITVLSWRPIDLVAINRYYGTSIQASALRARRVSPLLGPVMDLIPVPFSLLKTSLLLRSAKQVAGQYDAVITVNNEADFGRRGIQYVHFPWAYHPRPPVDLRWYHFSPLLVEAYYRLCVHLCGFSFDRMKRNLTLVNSDWTGGKVRQRHGIDSQTLYPPVAGRFPAIPWETREDGFVCIGRISPEKELDKVIDVLSAVRARGRDVHLHIIGSADNPNYYQHIARRVRENADWLFLDESLSRDQLVQLVARHRYGLHGMTEEHFGMAVAEMVQAGCIPFVPRGGGQVEIVNPEARLLYETPEEAAAKIIHVLDNRSQQDSLRAFLAIRARSFSADRFMHRVRNIVRQFVCATITT